MNSSLVLCLSRHASAGYDRLKTWKYWRQKLSLGGLFQIQKKCVSPLFTYENNRRVSCKNNVFLSNISTAVLPFTAGLYISNEKLTPSKHSSYTLLACRSAPRLQTYWLLNFQVLPPWKIFRNISLLFFSQALFNRSKRCYYNEL